MNSARVYVRLYSGTTQFETNDKVLELPPPPLNWKDVIAAMVAAVGKTSEYEEAETTSKVRLFLLPTEATAERSLVTFWCPGERPVCHLSAG
uniref:Uncharacterized protein n=1 Tax=Hyaloperonospora arabidopsidis (strain Emoy2) TaxID=559515 RepID=M4BB20_HYAAE